ncbi:MAG: tyrosine-type recombinase/integrase [Paracoccaceae bacterium]
MGIASDSAKQYHYSATVVRLVLNWSVDNGFLESNACQNSEQFYEVDRSGIIWSPNQIERVVTMCPEWVARILITATETGLRIGDFTKLSWNQIETTPEGRRIRLKTNKRGIPAYIPVAPKMAKVLEETPNDRLLFLTNATDSRFAGHRASEGVR